MAYVSDSSVDIKSRTFVLFSVAMLVALYLAIPAGLSRHCPSYVIFSSDDGKVFGPDYNEFSLVRLDGEYWDVEGIAENELIVDRHGFNGWNSWKNYNKQGYDCTITFERKGNKIISYTENAGILIKNVIQIKIETKEVYVALSGDQVALTGIKIK